jgi:plastocyanin
VTSLSRSLPALLLAGALALPSAGAGQSVTERTPNLSGGWTGVPGTAHFNFLHRFEHGDPPARKVSNYPTFLMGYTPTRSLLLAANYATNSDLVPSYPNEWEFMARWGAPVGSARIALTGAYNLAAESFDGEALARLGTSKVSVMGVARGFSAGYGDDARFAVGGGAILALHPNFALAGDVVTLLERNEYGGSAEEEIAWSAGAQIRIPTTPHSLSLHVTNTNTATLQGSSRGGDKVRGGFEFTIPLTLSRWFGGGGGGGAAANMTGQDTVIVTIRDFAFDPANITIWTGTTVVWVNEGQVAHTATSAGAFDTGLIQPRARASYTFRQAGEHAYLCTPHPFMTGRVGVQGGDQ